MVSDFGFSRDVYESGEYENTSGVWKYTLMISIKLLAREHPRDQNTGVRQLLYLFIGNGKLIFPSLSEIQLHLDWIKSTT